MNRNITPIVASYRDRVIAGSLTMEAFARELSRDLPASPPAVTEPHPAFLPRPARSSKPVQESLF